MCVHYNRSLDTTNEVPLTSVGEIAKGNVEAEANLHKLSHTITGLLFARAQKAIKNIEHNEQFTSITKLLT